MPKKGKKGTGKSKKSWWGDNHNRQGNR